jgi:cadmium resistance protein CadD (predicted permease)
VDCHLEAESIFAVLTVGVVVFASTNVDDIFLLSAFFVDPHLAVRNVVLGQFLGIGTLVIVSACAALAALAVPPGWTALLGIFPLAIGLAKLRQLRTDQEGVETDGSSDDREHRLEERTHSQILAVAGVTIANGGDNLGVYIPLFANGPKWIAVYAALFALMTAIWCAVGYTLVNNPVAGQHARRYGHVVLPFVLVGLGLYILSDALVLLP